jgi:hypothetical protein
LTNDDQIPTNIHRIKLFIKGYGRMRPKLVLIKWLDSKGGSPEWEFLEEIKPLEPITCISVGFLIEETDHYKTIAPTLGGGQVLGRITIPSCSIVKVQELAK